jgi:hypothetical protein
VMVGIAQTAYEPQAGMIIPYSQLNIDQPREHWRYGVGPPKSQPLKSQAIVTPQETLCSFALNNEAPAWQPP